MIVIEQWNLVIVKTGSTDTNEEGEPRGEKNGTQQELIKLSHTLRDMFK